MPTVLRIGPYRFHFYSRESNEPPHIHVARDDLEVKFWLKSNFCWGEFGFAASEVNDIRRLVEEHCDFLIEAYNRFPWRSLNSKQKRHRPCDAGSRIAAFASSLPMNARLASPRQSFRGWQQQTPNCSNKSACASREELSAGRRSMRISGSAR
jgi:hypothetical protein